MTKKLWELALKILKKSMDEGDACRPRRNSPSSNTKKWKDERQSILLRRRSYFWQEMGRQTCSPLNQVGNLIINFLIAVDISDSISLGFWSCLYEDIFIGVNKLKNKCEIKCLNEKRRLLRWKVSIFIRKFYLFSFSLHFLNGFW